MMIKKCFWMLFGNLSYILSSSRDLVRGIYHVERMSRISAVSNAHILLGKQFIFVPGYIYAAIRGVTRRISRAMRRDSSIEETEDVKIGDRRFVSRIASISDTNFHMFFSGDPCISKEYGLYPVSFFDRFDRKVVFFDTRFLVKYIAFRTIGGEHAVQITRAKQ